MTAIRSATSAARALAVPTAPTGAASAATPPALEVPAPRPSSPSATRVSWFMRYGRDGFAAFDAQGRIVGRDRHAEGALGEVRVDPKRGGVVTIDSTPPGGRARTSQVLALPKEYDGPIFVSEIDDALRETRAVELLTGTTPPPIAGSKELLEAVAHKGVPILYLSAGPPLIRPHNKAFLEQLPPGVLMDRSDFWSGLFTRSWARGQAEYKAEALGELRRMFPKAQLFGLGTDKYGDAMAYTRQGATAYIQDLRLDDANIPANFEGALVKGYGPALQHKISGDLDLAIAQSSSFGGQPRPEDWLARTTATLDRLTGAEATTGNRIEPLIDGDAVLPEVLSTIDGAQRSLYYQTYNFRDAGDRTTAQIVDRLIAAHRRGVVVRMVIDAAGGKHFPPLRTNSQVRRLRDAGVDVRIFNPIDGLDDLYALKRNHSKSIIADNEVAWLGGMNTGEEYMGPPSERRYHDLFARLRGPEVRDAVADFYDAYAEAGGGAVPAAEREIPPASPSPDGGDRIRFISHRPRKDHAIRSAYLALIDAAQDHVYLETGFPLAEDVIGSLAAAAQRGVDVRVIADRGDGVISAPAQRGLQTVIDSGGRVFEYPKLVHTKALSVDGKIGVIGSSNFDSVSLERNREIAAVIEQPSAVQALDRDLFEQDLVGDEQSHRPTVERDRNLGKPWWKRLWNALVEWLWPDSFELSPRAPRR